MDEQIIKNKNWGDVFKHAGEGVLLAISTQKNYRIHFLLSLFSLVLAIWLSVSLEKIIILIFAITFGLTVETLNTAFEKTVDLITGEYHPLAKAAKDISAGAMLIVSIGMAMVGLLILLPPLWQRFFS